MHNLGVKPFQQNYHFKDTGILFLYDTFFNRINYPFRALYSNLNTDIRE